MATTPLAKRLLIKTDYQVRLYNAPDHYRDLLGTLPEGVTVVEQGDGPFDAVLLFAQNSGILNRDGPKALKAVRPDGLLWISYPKRSSKVETDLTRDRGWAVIENAGWRGIAQVAIDETWAATRFRPADKVGK